MLKQSFIKLSYMKSNQVFRRKNLQKRRKFDINKFKHAEFNVLALLPYTVGGPTPYIHNTYANTYCIQNTTQYNYLKTK